MTWKDMGPETVDELVALQESRFRWTVRHAYENSPFYRKKFDAAGIMPGDIRGLADLPRLPFTDKEELKENYPMGLAAVPGERIVRIHASSGTTGKRTIAYYTQKDIDDWADMMARCFYLAGVTPLDRVLVTPGYGLWTAGMGFQLGIERLGAMAVPAGPIGIDMHLELMMDLGVTAFSATSSYALLLGEEVQKRDVRDRLQLRVGLIGSERWSDKMRQRIEELLGIESFDIIGMTELYGPGIGLDCMAHQGIHYWADYFVFEVVDPATGKVCAPGEQGELVATTLTREAMPVIRYRTRDLTRLIPGLCPCGSPMYRIDRILGRTDDMIKVKGVALFPGQIDHVLSRVEGVGSEYRLVLRREEGRDSMTVRVEAAEGTSPVADLTRRVAQEIKMHLGLTAEVEVVPHGTLPRTERKTRRIIDERDL